MTLGLCFWILMLIALVFGFAWHSGYMAGPMGSYGPYGFSLLTPFLFGLLGWRTFGPPLRG